MKVATISLARVSHVYEKSERDADATRNRDDGQERHAVARPAVVRGGRRGAEPRVRGRPPGGRVRRQGVRHPQHADDRAELRAAIREGAAGGGVRGGGGVPGERAAAVRGGRGGGELAGRAGRGGAGGGGA